MRNYVPFTVITVLYVITLVLMGYILQPQQLSVVKDSLEQDVSEWDILIDSLSLDSNDVPSLLKVDWAYAVLDSQSIIYSSAELSNSVINDSSFVVNQWMIHYSSFGIYLQKYVPKDDRFLFVEIDLSKEWPNVLSYQKTQTVDYAKSHGISTSANFLLSSRKPDGVKSLAWRIGRNQESLVVYISRPNGYFAFDSLLVCLGLVGGLLLYLLFILGLKGAREYKTPWISLLVPACMMIGHLMVWFLLFGGVFPSSTLWDFSIYRGLLNVLVSISLLWSLLIQVFRANVIQFFNETSNRKIILWEGLLFVSFILLVMLTRSLIFGVGEPFAFDNIARVNPSSVIIGITSFFLVYSMYCIIRRLVDLRERAPSSSAWYIRYLPYGVFLGFLFYRNMEFWLFLTSLVFLTLYLTEFSLQRGNVMLSTLVVVAGFALFTAVYGDLVQKEKWVRWLETSNKPSWSAYSEEIEADFYMLDSLVKQDPYLAGQRMFLSQLSEDQLAQRFKRKYFRGIWSIYTIEAFLYNPNKTIGDNEEGYEFAQWLDSLQEESPNTAYDNLFRLNKEDRPSYAMLFELGETYGATTLILRCTPTYSPSSQRYLGFIYDAQTEEKVLSSIYSVGFYSEGLLHHNRGKHTFPLHLKQANSIASNQRNLYTKKTYGDGEVVIQHIVSPSLLDLASYASYLFFLFFVCFGLLEGLYWVGYRINRWVENNERIDYASYRRRIIGSVLGLVVVSFVLISAISVINFSIRQDDYHKDRLTRKTKAIRSAVEFKLNSLSASYLGNNGIQLLNEGDLQEIAAIHGLDIDVYNAQGLVSTSSEYQVIVDRLVDVELHQGVMNSLNDQDNVAVFEDTILRNPSLSSYATIRDLDGAVLGYIHIPYFDKSESDISELSEFLLSLVNIYAIVLLLAAFVTHTIAKRLTQPIEALVERMQSVQSLDKNEGLVWERNDEFGRLVSAYNALLVQVEESARRLARNERENTWRQIAKQIAHEIKNPLTPMKLNLQHLQTIRKDNEADYQERVNHLSKSLLSQIDNLTAIVDAFSAFSQMPKANAESFDMGQLVKEVIALFGHHKGVRLECKEDEVVTLNIFADRNHFVSVFNNLIKNAIQACEQKITEVDVLVRLSREDKFVRVDVIDQGIGISEEDKVNVFVPNFTTKSTGSGLGLAIARQIIENVEGSIGFVSKEGEGSTFYFLVPLQDV
ncbi:MAG TPA: hypothetical protein DCF84_03480 [Bacteroidetes bacterium]|nr:hypothetical protein [Bacteroidota bacterium]